MGYDFKPVFRNSTRFGIKGSILTGLNEYYFTDVSNPANSNTNIVTLQVFFNKGRRTYTVDLSVTL